MEQKNTLKGVALVMFSILIWSGWVVASRFGVKGTLTSYDITAIRFTTAGLVMLPVIIKKGLRLGPWGIKSAFLCSLLIGATYNNIVVTGMKFAPVSHAGTINSGTFLIVIILFGIHGLREHVSKVRLVGVALSIAGIATMLASKGSGGENEWIGHLCFIIGGIIWAAYVLLARHWRLDPVHATSVVCVFSMITYMPLYLIFAQSHIGLSNWQAVVFQALYQGILTAIVAFFTFNRGVHILGASRAGAFVPLIPAISTLMAIPILGEVPSLLEIAGIALVSIGVFLATGIVRFKAKS